MLTQQQKLILGNQIRSNSHEVYVVSFEEMDAVVRSSPAGTQAKVQETWGKIRDKAELGAGYYSWADDVVTLTKLMGDLGAIGTRVLIKSYGGKPHIILKGAPGLRKVLTGTKYGIQNPKVITLGLGRAGAVSAARAGGLITVVLLTGFRVADYVLTDEATWSQLVGRLATDIVKVGITVGASIVAATLFGFTTLAIGPIVAVVGVGLFGSMYLESLDKRYGITDKVVAGLDEMGEDATVYLERRMRELGEVAGTAIDYAIGSARYLAVNWVRARLRRLPRPRLGGW